MSDRPLEGRLIVLGVTGSIAAYKAAELLRLLTAAGAEVQVMMSRTATAFIGPLTMETLSGRPVMLDPLELRFKGLLLPRMAFHATLDFGPPGVDLQLHDTGHGALELATPGAAIGRSAGERQERDDQKEN